MKLNVYWSEITHYNAEIVVDDSSKDNTVEVITNYKNKYIKVLTNKVNRGKGYSVKKGLLAAKYQYALFSDADLSTPIESLDRLIIYINQYDIVIGSRKLPNSRVVEKQPWWRVMAGNIFPRIVQLLMIRDIKDTQCGFKLFNMKKCRKILEKMRINGFSFDVEILYLAKKNKLKIKEVGVEWYNSSESKLKFFKHSVTMLTEIIQIQMNELTKKY